LTHVSGKARAVEVARRLHLLSAVLPIPAQITNAVIRVICTVVRALDIALVTRPANVARALAFVTNAVVVALLRAVPVAALHRAIAIEFAAIVLVGPPRFAHTFAVSAAPIGYERYLLGATLVRAVTVAALEPTVRHFARLQGAAVVGASPARLAMAQRLVAHAVARALCGTILVTALDFAAGELGPAIVTIGPPLILAPLLAVPARALSRRAIAMPVTLALAVTVAAFKRAVTKRLAAVVFVVPTVVALAQTVVTLTMAGARHSAIRPAVAVVIAQAVAIHHKAVARALGHVELPVAVWIPLHLHGCVVLKPLLGQRTELN